MGNLLVKIKIRDDGSTVDDPPWCLVVDRGGQMAFCSGEYFGGGESAAVYEVKVVKRSGITCNRCLEYIEKIKSVKL